MQCSCPRCGEPFDYHISINDEEDDPEKENSIRKGLQAFVGLKTLEEVTRQSIGQGLDDTGDVKSNESTDEDPSSIDLSSEESTQPIKLSQQDAIPRGQKRKSHRHKTVGLIALIFLFIFTVDQSTRVSKGDAQLYTSSHVDSTATENSYVDGSAKSLGNASAETPPRWLEGTWKVKTDYGEIRLVIRGNQISETIGGFVSQGTFYYHHHCLYCDFGDGETFIYRLDMREHRVDAGENVLMQKVR